MLRREDVKELLPIMQAFAEGKQIQEKLEGYTDWLDTDEINFVHEGIRIKYRIKPESKYRPFNSQEECWEEMLKHQPFGWIKNNVGNIFNIISIINQKHAIKLNECYSKYSDLFKDFKFIDGTPFGIKKDI